MKQNELKDIVDKSVKREKLGGKESQAPLIVQLFETRRELMSKISEDIFKEKKLLDLELGFVVQSFSTANLAKFALTIVCGRIPETGAGEEKDVLASWDTQLYISFH